MSTFDGLVHRVRVLLRGEAYAREQEREVRFHLELDTMARSADRDAELAARRAFGNVGYYREEMRHMTSLATLDRLRRNLAYAVRGLRRTPGFSAAVVATIALGVGLNAGMFSLLDRVLLRPPAGVVAPVTLRRLYISVTHAVTNRGGHVATQFSYANFQGVRDAVRDAEFIAYTPAALHGLGDGGAIFAHVSYVSSNYFAMLGVRPVVGRTFGDAESGVEMPTPVMVISERLWRSGFGSDPHVLGRVVRSGMLQLTIVGIVPPEFAGLDLSAADAWVPLSMFDAGSISGRSDWYVNGRGDFLTVVARLHPAANETEINQRGALAIRTLREQLTGTPDSSAMLMGPVIEARGPVEEPTELTLSTRIAGVATIVLLIASANVATLLLVRATRRRREIAVRRALGASRSRLYEQLITESILLAVLGAVAATLLATWGGTLLRTLLFPRVNWAGASIDWRVAAFIGGVATIIGVIAGLVPAASSERADVMSALRAGATESAHRRSVASSVLLGVQAALCVVLLVGAGLFVHSLANVLAIDIGFDKNQIVFANLTTTPERRWGPEATPLLAQAASAMHSVPGVRSTALAYPPPMGGIALTRIYRPNGDSVFRIGADFPAYTAASPEYFQTVGVRLAAGRLFTDADRAETSPVMIVSKKMARLVWPGASAVGQCLILDKPGNPCTTVVGVVEDTHRMQIVEAPGLQYYLALAQRPGPAPMVLVRADPSRVGAVITELRAQVIRNVSGARWVQSRSLEELLGGELHSWRLGATLFTVFGLLALCVAAIGIYSVVAYAVSQRTHEMGVRIALGASVRDILDLVVRDRLLVVGAGVAAGVVAALALGRFVAPLLFGVTSSDPSTIVGAAAVLTATAIAASLVPAWRAARTDPASALRAD